ncbi:MAG: 2-dehydropantoate 2-reductase N-terminal domain-containing protein [Thermodesulfobacteriota bacterium]
MKKKLLFIGAGAVGCYLGAFLSRAGHDVTFVDPWAENVETIRRQGIRATGPHEPLEARPATVHLNDAAHLPGDFDIVFVAMKVYDTAWASQLALRHLAPQGFVVSSQNCWPDPVMAGVVGASRAVGLVMSNILVALWKPGQTERGVDAAGYRRQEVFRPGEHDGRMTPRVIELAEMLSVIDGAQPTNNLWGERWAKLSQNAMGNPVQALSGMGSVEVSSTAEGRAIQIHLAAESARVGLALGYSVPKFRGAPAEQWADASTPSTYDALDRHLTPTAPNQRNWRASMAQDVFKGRRTEIEEMNGFVVARGRECSVTTPVSEAAVEAVRRIDAGLLKPAPENIAQVLRRAGIPLPTAT